MLQLNSPCVSLWASVSQVEVPVDDTKEEEEVREQGDEQQAQGQDSEQKADQDEEDYKGDHRFWLEILLKMTGLTGST